MSFRNPKLFEREDDVVCEPDRTLPRTPGNNAAQPRPTIRIFADNSGETALFDWYKA